MSGPFIYQTETPNFKVLFAPGVVEPMSMKTSIFRQRIGVTDTFGGDSVRSRPMRYALPQARSRTDGIALQERYTANAPLAQWTMKAGYDYATMRVGYADILRARSDSMAYERTLTLASQSTLETLNRSLNTSLWRDGTGYMAVVAATGTTAAGGGTIPASGLGALALTNAADSYVFDPGMSLQFFNTVTSNVPNVLNGGQTVNVVAVDFEAGYVYIDTLPSSVTSLAANTYIIQAGDGVGFGSTLENGSIAGVGAYIPLTVPAAGATLWGQDISVHPQKLTGWRKDARGLNKLEEVQRLLARVSRFRPEGRFSVYAAPEQITDMIIGRDVLTENFREVKTYRGDNGDGGEVVAEVGYSGVNVHTPAGMVPFFSESFIPPDRIYVLDESTWHLESQGAFPHLVEMGMMNGLLQEQDGFAVQARLFASAQLWCDAPLYNGVLQVTPVF